MSVKTSGIAPTTHQNIRRLMNEICDAMATGVCKDYADYKYMVGRINGLAEAEAFLIAEQDKMEGIGRHSEEVADETLDEE